MSQSRTLAEQMRPFLRAMEQSIDAVRRERTGGAEPSAEARNNPKADHFSGSGAAFTDEPSQKPADPSAAAEPSVAPAPPSTPAQPSNHQSQVKSQSIARLGEARPLSYDGSGLPDEDEEERPRLKARPKRSSSMNQPNRPEPPTYDVHSRAG